MRAFFVYLILTVCIGTSCKTDDRLPKVIGSFQEDSSGSQACANAVYGNWQESNYVLPYPVGKSYSVHLNHCSSSYHGPGQPDQFAVDFSMNIGQTITAARGGTVVYVEESGSDYNFPNNLVVVQHLDGTFAQYMHLTKDGAAVDIGQAVIKGTVLGKSGATGLAGYPHLHFVLTAAGEWEWPYSSIPYNFKNTAANPKGPDQGSTYKALPY